MPLSLSRKRTAKLCKWSNRRSGINRAQQRKKIPRIILNRPKARINRLSRVLNYDLYSNLVIQPAPKSQMGYLQAKWCWVMDPCLTQPKLKLSTWPNTKVILKKIYKCWMTSKNKSNCNNNKSRTIILLKEWWQSNLWAIATLRLNSKVNCRK